MIIQIGLHIHHLTNGSYLFHTSDESKITCLASAVQLKLMNIATKQIQVITPVFYGGQGTFNVPSWSSE
jgi:Tol biopolymer transport system component